MKKQEIKVQITLSEGYQERFTRACIRAARRRVEEGEDEGDRRKEEKRVAF